jgi:transglutaminase-like putative cysteine protease
VTYRLNHLTSYHYSQPVMLSHHVARLTPRVTPVQIPHSGEIVVEPRPAVRETRLDYFGNENTFFVVQESHQHLRVETSCEVTVAPHPSPDPAKTPAWEGVRDGLSQDLTASGLRAYEMAFDSPCVPTGEELGDYARPSFPANRPILEATLDLTSRIYRDFTFDTRATTVSTPLQSVMMSRRGVCQDFAHLQIGCLRSLGLSARYVSGYVQTIPPAGQTRLTGADASHAWLAVWCPGHGWFEVDPTNNQAVTAQHVTLAWGRDFSDVSPLRGVIIGGGQHGLTVRVEMTPVVAVEAEPVGVS